MLTDLRFDPSSPAAGDALPELDLETTDGHRLTVGSLDRPHLFVFGSRICPMTVSARDGLHELHAEFGETLRFVLVQVREAHPGVLIPQPTSIAQKREHATRLKAALDIPFDVAVDDIDGSFHRSLDPKPNAAYLVDSDGIILFRSQWTSDVDGIRAALDAVANDRTPHPTQSTRMAGPIMAALAHIHDVVGSGGKQARRDLIRAAPPMAAAGWLAAQLNRSAR